MSNLLHFAPLVGHAGKIQQAIVRTAVEGADVTVQLTGTTQLVECHVLRTGATNLALSEGDSVLVWVQDDAVGSRGVVLGCTGPYTEAMQPVVSPEQFADRPPAQVIEAQGDLVLRNGQAKIKLSADGDVEILCSNFTTRTRRLARLLAPLIRFN